MNIVHPGASSFLSVLGTIFWVIQLGLLVHVFKTGRPFWWFIVLLVAPVLGALLYLFLEVIPELRRPRGGYFSGLKPRSWRIRELRSQLEETDVVRTRLDLAGDLLESGRPEEAHAIAAGALHGVFRDDPHTLVAVARFKLAIDRPDEALALLQRVEIRADRLLEQQKLLLEGRAYLGLGELARAEERFRYLEGRHVGDEPRYHLAMTLLANQRRDEAVSIWQEIVKRFRRAGPAWRRTEKQWYRLAKQRLQELSALSS